MIDISTIIQYNDGLRPHQVEAKNNILKAWKEHDAVMLQMPTGTGKTYLFTSIINDLIQAYKKERKEINILVVAHRTELLDQISNTLSRYAISHGFIQGTREQHLWKRVQVGSIQSLLTDKNYRNTLRQNFDYIIVDEAHHSLADTYVRLFECFPDAKKLGVTATPWRFNHESFLKLYQKLILSPKVSWFIENALLSDFDYVSIKPDSEIQTLVDKTEIADTGDFVNSELDYAFNNMRIRAKVFESYKKFANGRKGIIYTINKQHAANIAALYSSQGVMAVAIDCDTPKDERQHLIELFKSGEIKVLVNVEIFTEGFDCPDVSFIQLARPTRSLALYLQQVGRGLRMVAGKEKTIIIDNVGLYNYFGLPDTNRKWMHHFIGRELDEDEKKEVSQRESMEVSEPSSEYDETNFEEDNEEMLVVRGARIQSHAFVDKPQPKETEKATETEEFSLCDYYLVRGHSQEFRIYPFIKKRGKNTEGVGKCLYAFKSSEKKMELSLDPSSNKEMLEQDFKLHTILSFSASIANTRLQDIYNIKSFMSLSPSSQNRSIFDILKRLADVYHEANI